MRYVKSTICAYSVPQSGLSHCEPGADSRFGATEGAPSFGRVDD